MIKKSKLGLKYDVVVSGSSEMKTCAKGTKEKARQLGMELAKNKCFVISGATNGISYEVSCANREAGGINVGFSPAISKAEHVRAYKLPFDPYDIIIYTGADYAGRDVMMTKSGEAAIIVSGRTGTMHEFLTAFELGKPIGVLEGTGGAADLIKEFLKRLNKKPKAPIFYSTDPKELVRLVCNELKIRNKELKK